MIGSATFFERFRHLGLFGRDRERLFRNFILLFLIFLSRLFILSARLTISIEQLSTWALLGLSRSVEGLVLFLFHLFIFWVNIEKWIIFRILSGLFVTFLLIVWYFVGKLEDLLFIVLSIDLLLDLLGDLVPLFDVIDEGLTQGHFDLILLMFSLFGGLLDRRGMTVVDFRSQKVVCVVKLFNSELPLDIFKLLPLSLHGSSMLYLRITFEDNQFLVEVETALDRRIYDKEVWPQVYNPTLGVIIWVHCTVEQQPELQSMLPGLYWEIDLDLVSLEVLTPLVMSNLLDISKAQAFL